MIFVKKRKIKNSTTFFFKKPCKVCKKKTIAKKVHMMLTFAGYGARSYVMPFEKISRQKRIEFFSKGLNKNKYKKF